MFKKLLLEQIISFENLFNGFIYYLREIPFFKKRIPYGIFKHNKFKRVLSIVIFLFGILMKFVGRFIYAIVFLMIPYLILRHFVMDNTFQYEETVINVFFMMNCICGSLVNTVMLSSSDEDYMMLNTLKINPKEHYVGELLFKLITDFGLFFAVLCLLDIGVVNSLILVTLMTAFRCIGELLSLFIFSKLKFLYRRITSCDVVVILVCTFFAYVFPFMRGRMIRVERFAFNSVLMAVICVAGLLSFVILCSYRHYPRLARKCVKRVDQEYAEEVIARSRISAVEMKNTVTGKAALVTNRHDKKKGYSYLNHIFFDRNHRILLKSSNKRVLWSVLIAVTAILYTISLRPEQRENVWNFVKGMDTIWFLIMYVLNCSHRMCRTVFYNCDKDLMHNHFYRTSKSLVSNFWIRVVRFALIDMRVAVVFSVMIIVLADLTGHLKELGVVIPIILIIFLCSVIVSVYHVAMYHVFQPYNAQMKEKSATYTIVNILVGVFGIVYIEIPFNSIMTLIVGVFSLIAIIAIAMMHMISVAPRNFYIKK